MISRKRRHPSYSQKAKFCEYPRRDWLIRFHERARHCRLAVAGGVTTNLLPVLKIETRSLSRLTRNDRAKVTVSQAYNNASHITRTCSLVRPHLKTSHRLRYAVCIHGLMRSKRCVLVGGETIDTTYKWRLSDEKHECPARSDGLSIHCSRCMWVAACAQK